MEIPLSIKTQGDISFIKNETEVATKAEDIQRDITKNRKKINDQKLVQQSWFPFRKAFKNYTKSFGIKIINPSYTKGGGVKSSP